MGRKTIVAVICLVLALSLFFFHRAGAGDERLIRRTLARVAGTVSLRPGESAPRLAARVRVLPEYFSEDFVFSLEPYSPGSVSRVEIPVRILALHGHFQSLRLAPLDVTVTVNEDGRGASTRFILKAEGVEHTGARFIDALEMNLAWRRLGDRWLISRAEFTPILY